MHRYAFAHHNDTPVLLKGTRTTDRNYKIHRDGSGMGCRLLLPGVSTDH